ncbi:hypothetical protein ABT324_00365 [Saccharopolyspora sp. NPDC000359]
MHYQQLSRSPVACIKSYRLGDPVTAQIRITADSPDEAAAIQAALELER